MGDDQVREPEHLNAGYSVATETNGTYMIKNASVAADAWRWRIPRVMTSRSQRCLDRAVGRPPRRAAPRAAEPPKGTLDAAEHRGSHKEPTAIG
jgi:hypothetical protein